MGENIFEDFLVVEDLNWDTTTYKLIKINERMLSNLKNRTSTVANVNYKLLERAFSVSNDYLIIKDNLDSSCYLNRKINLVPITPQNILDIITQYDFEIKKGNKIKVKNIHSNILVFMDLLVKKTGIPAEYVLGANVYGATDYELHEPGERFKLDRNPMKKNYVNKYAKCFEMIKFENDRMIVKIPSTSINQATNQIKRPEPKLIVATEKINKIDDKVKKVVLLNGIKSMHNDTSMTKDDSDNNDYSIKVQEHDVKNISQKDMCISECNLEKENEIEKGKYIIDENRETSVNDESWLKKLLLTFKQIRDVIVEIWVKHN